VNPRRAPTAMRSPFETLRETGRNTFIFSVMHSLVDVLVVPVEEP